MTALTNLPETVFLTVSFRWNLIESDADDNKFVDYAVAGNADYLVTNDSDFNSLARIEFPKVVVVSVEPFKTILGAG